jgi:hypothetical protein
MFKDTLIRDTTSCHEVIRYRTSRMNCIVISFFFGCVITRWAIFFYCALNVTKFLTLLCLILLVSPLLCVSSFFWYSHSSPYVAHFVFLRYVWIRTKRGAVESRRATINLATHLPNLAYHFPNLATISTITGCVMCLHLILVKFIMSCTKT